MEQKVIFITGASSGIGLETANYFLKNGWKVYGCARKKINCDFNFIECDVTDEEKVKEVYEKIFNKEKRLDAVVSCAGFGIGGAIEQTSLENIKKQFDVNFFGTAIVCKNAIKYLRETGGGKIITIGSVAGDIAIPFQAFYSATKSAIDSFSRALASEVRPFNIKVCCVLPGDAKTGFTSARIKEVEENSPYEKRIESSIKAMEKDEQGGYLPIVVAKTIYKNVMKKSPKVTVAVGFKYKLVVGLNRFLPKKLVQKIVYKIYAK